MPVVEHDLARGADLTDLTDLTDRTSVASSSRYGFVISATSDASGATQLNGTWPLTAS